MARPEAEWRERSEAETGRRELSLEAGLEAGPKGETRPEGSGWIIDGPAARSPVRPKGTGGGPTTGTVKNRIRLSVILLIILL